MIPTTAENLVFKNKTSFMGHGVMNIIVHLLCWKIYVQQSLLLASSRVYAHPILFTSLGPLVWLKGLYVSGISFFGFSFVATRQMV